MKIRAKFLLTFLFIFIIVLLGDYVLDRMVFTPSYQKIEIANHNDHLLRIHSALSDRLQVLKKLNNDWAIWDDAYDFILSRSSSFIEKNIGVSTFLNADLSTIAFFDNQAKLIYGKYFSILENQFLPIENSAFIQNAHTILPKLAADQNSLEGLIFDPSIQKAVQFSINRVFDTNQKKESPGLIIMTQMLSDNFWARLQQQTVHSFEVVLPSSLTEELLQKISSAQYHHLTILNDQQINGYIQISDIHNKPIIVLKTSESAKIISAGKMAITISTKLIILIFIICFIILTASMEINVFHRIKKIQTTVAGIKNNDQDLKIRIIDSSKDEINALSNSINHMLEIIQNANQHRDKLQTNLFLSSKMASVGELAGGIAHEINNPLTILQMAVDDLKTVCAFRCNYERISDFYEIHTKTIARMAMIAKYLIEYTTPDNEYNPSCVPLKVINQTFVLLQKIYEQQNIFIKLNIISDSHVIPISSKNFQIILLNIISNAKESFVADQANKVININDSINFDANTYNVEIHDTGRGIPPANLEKIFDNFFTTHPTRNSLGLGLPLTQNLVNKGNGKISVESVLGSGTIVKIAFPILAEGKHS
jgi:signal transduction histidine kinase